MTKLMISKITINSHSQSSQKTKTNQMLVPLSRLKGFGQWGLPPGYFATSCESFILASV